MSGVNKAILVGNVGQIESKPTKTGDMMVTLSLATSEKYKNTQGEMVEDTTWHDVVFFGKAAATIAQYVTKGSKLYVEGKIKKDKWVTPTGENRTAVKIIGRDFQFLSTKPEGQQQVPAYAPQNFNTPQEGIPFTDDIPF